MYGGTSLGENWSQTCFSDQTHRLSFLCLFLLSCWNPPSAEAAKKMLDRTIHAGGCQRQHPEAKPGSALFSCWSTCSVWKLLNAAVKPPAITGRQESKTRIQGFVSEACRQNFAIQSEQYILPGNPKILRFFCGAKLSCANVSGTSGFLTRFPCFFTEWINRRAATEAPSPCTSNNGSWSRQCTTWCSKAAVLARYTVPGGSWMVAKGSGASPSQMRRDLLQSHGADHVWNHARMERLVCSGFNAV